MKLFVMRHGPAEDESPSGRDHDRVLSPKGRGRVHAVALALIEASERPGVIVTSPLARALQTAEIVAAALGRVGKEPTLTVRRELEPGGASKAFMDELVDPRPRKSNGRRARARPHDAHGRAAGRPRREWLRQGNGRGSDGRRRPSRIAYASC